MIFVDINSLLPNIPKGIDDSLKNQHDALTSDDDLAKYNRIKGGNAQWRRVKALYESASHKKCWYTESKNPGCYYNVEHFRPKAQFPDEEPISYWYWFLAFQPSNYRISCDFSNTTKSNHFPLISGNYAQDAASVPLEQYQLLDPCNQSDTELLAFQEDGLARLAPQFEVDSVASVRVETTIKYLNLNHANFVEDRKKIYNKIVKLISAVDANSISVDWATNEFRDLVSPSSAYSKAAWCYLAKFRDRDWVEQIILE